MISVISPKECLHCKIFHEIGLPNNITSEKFFADLDAIGKGSHIQHQMSYLTIDQREMLITGFCAKGWDALFSDEEKE